MVATPITVYEHGDCAGHIITVFQDFTATGVGANTVTLNAGYPFFDLTKNHPILSLTWICTEGDDISQSETAMDITSEVARGTAADSDGEFDIEGANSFKVYSTNNKNGILMITYWAAGCKAL